MIVPNRLRPHADGSSIDVGIKSALSNDQHIVLLGHKLNRLVDAELNC